MLKLKRIAITGGIASGKSTVCQLFAELGAFVVGADVIVHELLDPNTDLGRKIIHTLGPDIVENGKIARPIVAKKVFENPALLRELERITHPAVLKHIEQHYKHACSLGKKKPFIVEMPLLYEIGQEAAYDVVVAVDTDLKLALERWCAIGHSAKEYAARMQRQIPVSEKTSRADYIIQNNGTLQDLKEQVQKLYKIFTQER